MFEGLLAPVFFVVIFAIVIAVAGYRRRCGPQALPRGGARDEADAERARGRIGADEWRRRRG